LSGDIDSLRACLQEGLTIIKKAIDLSVKIKLENPGDWKEASGLWEVFIGQVWRYIKTQNARLGQNLLQGISLLRLRS